MTPTILDFIQAYQPKTHVGDVLEVGSCNINGTPRTVLQNVSTSYTGIDILPGNCVDIVIDAEHLLDNFKPTQFDTVVCCECLEHCLHPWIIVHAMRTVLKPGGHLWISAPTFGFPEHRYPIDCYRFGRDVYIHYFFKDMNILALETVVDYSNNPCIVGLAKNVLPSQHK